MIARATRVIARATRGCELGSRRVEVFTPPTPSPTCLSATWRNALRRPLAKSRRFTTGLLRPAADCQATRFLPRPRRASHESDLVAEFGAAGRTWSTLESISTRSVSKAGSCRAPHDLGCDGGHAAHGIARRGDAINSVEKIDSTLAAFRCRPQEASRYGRERLCWGLAV